MLPGRAGPEHADGSASREREQSQGHYYIHVSGKTSGADFSTTGAGADAPEYRPRRYVPFKVPVFDEAATLKAEMTRRKAMAQGTENVGDAEPVYQWVYRPEMQFSLSDFDVRKIELTDDIGIPEPVMSESAEIHLLNSLDRDVSMVYALSQDIVPVLPQFGPPREHLVFSLGGQEARAVFNPSGPVVLENADHISLLEPSNYIAIRLFQNGDDPNVLWEYAFGDADLDIWVPEVIAGSPARVPDQDELDVGSVTFVNLDNDDNDSFFDSDDSSVSGGDDELVRLELKVQPPTLADKNVRLTAVSGGDCVRIWKSADKSAGEYNPGDLLTLTEKGNFLAADLWAEGIKAHSSQRQTVLRLEYPAYNPEYTDEVALTVVGIESIEWKGRNNGYSTVPGTDIRDCTSSDLDTYNGSRRVFPGARQGDPVSRDKVDFDITLTVKPPYDIKVYCRALDADDPSSDPTVDPNDSSSGTGSYCANCPSHTPENDNRGDTDGSKAGRIKGETEEGALKVREVCFDAGTDRVTNEFQTTMSPGDNFVVAANGDRNFILKLRNRDKDDGDRIVNRDPVSGVGGTGTEIREPANYMSEVLTVWRILHTERDSMKPPPASGTEKNFVEGKITEIKGNGAVATNVRTENSLADGSASMGASPGKGRFENGWIRIGSDLVLTEGLMGNSGYLVFKQEGIDIPAVVTKESMSDIVAGKITDLTGNKFTLNITSQANLTPDYAGGTISVAGTEMTIAGVPDSNTVLVTAPEDIPYILHDDDADSGLPHTLSDAKADNAFFDAYYLPTVDGGNDPGNNQTGLNASVEFFRNADGYELEDDTEQGSKDYENDNFWIIYVSSAWQYNTVKDLDPDNEGIILGITYAASGNNIPESGANASWIFIESYRDYNSSFILPKVPTRKIEDTYVHEIGHQLGLGEFHGNKTIMSYDPNRVVKFCGRHINLLRCRVRSPSY